MAINDFLADLVAKGLRTQDLLDDRLQKPDGLLMVDASRFIIVPAAATTWSVERNAVGDYRQKRTSAGAETHYLVLPLSTIARTVTNKGYTVQDVFIAYSVTTIDATSVDVTVQASTFANASGPTVATYGGAATYDSNHDTAAKRKSSTGGSNPHLMTVTLAGPTYQNTDAVWLSAEVAIVIPNTCVFRLYGGGFHLAHDYL